MNEQNKKRGRPITGCAKTNVVAMRIDDETRDALCDICNHYGISKSKLLKKWTENQHKMMENGIDLL